jgi:putative MATE family efflux protein
MIVTSVAIGLGAGTSSVVARAIGKHDQRRARRLATDSLLLSFLITGAMCICGILTIGPLFRMLGAPEDMIPLIAGYMTILYIGVPFVVVGMVGMSSMRATGDTRLPSRLMVIAAVLNMILDPILIFGIGPIPAMGLNGAAMAALLARAAIFAGTIYFMRYRMDMLSFNKPHAKELRDSWVDILHVGIPAAATNAIIPIATAVITAMLAGYGPEAVAGFRSCESHRRCNAGAVLCDVGDHRPVRRAERVCGQRRPHQRSVAPVPVILPRLGAGDRDTACGHERIPARPLHG